MAALNHLFGFSGRIGRLLFLLTCAGAAAGFWVTAQAAFALLPVLARLAAPAGLNAGLVLNGLWAAIGGIAMWIVLASLTKRLRATGYPAWLAALAIPALIWLGARMLPLLGPELSHQLAASVSALAGGMVVVGTGFFAASGAVFLALVGLCLFSADYGS